MIFPKRVKLVESTCALGLFYMYIYYLSYIRKSISCISTDQYHTSHTTTQRLHVHFTQNKICPVTMAQKLHKWVIANSCMHKKGCTLSHHVQLPPLPPPPTHTHLSPSGPPYAQDEGGLRLSCPCNWSSQ